jgi:hypothetical protein
MDGFYRTADGAQEIRKDADAILDYTFPWTDWLDGDTIDSAAITIADSPTMELASDQDHAAIPAAGYVISGGSVVVWLKGGEVRDRAAVSCLITTAAGRTDERTFYVRVVEK